MDPQSISNLLQAMVEQQDSSRQQIIALGNLIGQLQANQQGQTELLSRLVAGQPAQANGVYNPTNHPGRNRQLVDPPGVGKPGIRTGTIAENPSQFKTWRIKFASWILAVFPESHAILRGLEEQTTVEMECVLKPVGGKP